MNALEYIKFIGHSSVYPLLDELLSNDEITWRPNVRRSLDTTYFLKGQGLVLSFTIGADSMGIVKKSEGDYILEHLTFVMVEESRKNGKYVGPLPRGVLQGDSRSEIRAKLGIPKRSNDRLDNYYLDDLVWTVVFDGEIFEFLELAAPSDGKRKYGLCP